MKKFFERLMTDEETGQKFTKREIWVYGVLVPLGFIALMAIAGWMETSCA